MAKYFINVTLIATVTLTLLNVTGHSLPTNGTATKEDDLSFELVTREEWGAQPPRAVTPLAPPPFVVIHHTYLPGACFTADECKASMRNMQRYHQVDNGWDDIGYHFGVGSEGRVYEGRGWSVLGSQVAGFNSKSIGICLIGDWSSELPPKEQLEVTKKLIAYGVLKGFVPQNYTLVGHRQAGATECPGQALFDEIKSWPHYSPESVLK